MKRISFIALALICSISTFAGTITYTAKGDKAGPTSISASGTVTFDCNYSQATCGEVTVTTSNLQVPQTGDPTTVVTYVQNQVDFQVSGYFVSMGEQQNQNSVTHYVTLTF